MGGRIAPDVSYAPISDYPRRAHFDFYRAHPSPFYSVTFELEATRLRERLADERAPVYAGLCWHFHRALLTLPAFILLAAAYVPGTAIKARLKHPMTLAVKFWAIAHLLSNGRLADVLLFGSFLVWAVLVFSAARRRDRALGTRYSSAGWLRDAIAVVIGIGAWLAFALYLHGAWIGVRPFG